MPGRTTPPPDWHIGNEQWFPSFVHWVWYGKDGKSGLNVVPGQVADSFDPRSPAGLANLASLFAGGGKFDATPHMESLGMKGQFEQYSPIKANLGGELGSTHEGQPHQINYGIRASNKGVPPGRYGDWAKFIHDTLFGGEAHLKGSVPSIRSPHEFTQPPASVKEFLQRHHELKTRVEEGTPHFDAARAKKLATNRFLVKKGFQGGASRESMREILVRNNRDSRGDRRGGEQAAHDALGLHPARQAALVRLYAKMAHNHRN